MTFNKSAVVQQIEGEGKVQQVLVNGIPFWPFFKIHFFDQFSFGQSSVVKPRLKELPKLFKDSFYGNAKPDGGFETWAFSNSDQRRILNGMWYDRLVDPIAENIDDLLLFELPVPKHYPIEQVPTPHIRSRIDLKIREARYSKTRAGNVQLTGGEVLEELKQRFDVRIDVSAIATKFMAQLWSMQKLLRDHVPKRVFFVAPYISMGYVHALKSAGVEIIELQHGVINSAHEGYNLSYSPPVSLIPDQLWSFGQKEKRLFGSDNMMQFRPEQVIPVGHYYLEAILKQRAAIVEELKGYSSVVAVSLQEDTLGDQLVPFIYEAAHLDPNIAYVLIPRKRPPSHYEQFGKSDNVHFLPDLNVYEIIALSDLHCTMFSTCAVESLSLGVPNVLVNIEGKAQEYFGQELGEEQYTWYVGSPEDLVRRANEMPKVEKKLIMIANEENIVPNYSSNLQKALKALS